MSMPASPPRRPVVVGVDGGPAADRAVEVAVEQAQRTHRPLHILHATPLGLAPWTLDRLQAHEELARRSYERATEAAPDLEITFASQVADPATALVTASHTASLVVVGAGTHGQSASVLLGTTAHQVASHARCPVMVVPGSRKWSTTGPVVVGVDAAEHSVPAVEFAFAEASTRQAELVPVHTWWWEEPGPFLAGSEWEDEWIAVAQTQKVLVAEMLAGWQEKYPDVKVSLTSVRGQAAVVLQEVSQTAQLLVVGSRGRGGFAGLLLGSVSSRVLHDAKCPTVVAPSLRLTPSLG
ncbi:nucleotide-binding universal stress UspA family protein [Phycicoccus badiiscoriae]|uniref:Nucleotide-binding universal stress UspA family protein n=1 Tax=Pedococcus badiiscoriae TaxID=642776 RepID=A0A852W9E8_9MICO|nr:universal stress protein [Pedococcus badiiscoriae]NYG05653.1 nucleotide-binding universal stress UspA family protein [Pedococcus badiiscoriae]